MNATGSRHPLLRPACNVLVLGASLLQLLAADPARTTPPLPTPVKPPIELFRELLAAPPERREELLRTKSPAARDLISRRLREHEALDPAARAQAEWQLRIAQFRFYLSPLLRLPASERPARLAAAPAEDRPLLEERLRAWDTLAPAERAAVLESEDSLHHFVRSPGAEPARLASALAAARAAEREEIERQFARWSALPEAERTARTAAFQRFFDLSEPARNRTVSRLPDAERIAMERTLERFRRLPEAERARCVAGLGKLAALPTAEREEFLRNAARWQAMSPEERALWRRLVIATPPPPPLPTASPAAKSALVVTNR